MSYINANLLPDERVVFRTRLHWLLFLPPVLVIAVCAPADRLVARPRQPGAAYAWVPLAIGALLLLAAFIKRQSSDFAVTNKRVMTKVGVVNTRSIELLLGKIEAIAVEQSLLGRLFGYGDIVITGSGGTKEAFTRIQSPLAFRNAVQSVTDAAKPRRSPRPLPHREASSARSPVSWGRG